MKAIVWGLAALGVVGVALIVKKARGAERAPESIYGEQTRVALVVPAGWRRVSSSEVAALPELRAHASALLPTIAALPYGTLTPFVASDGRTYATWVEQHYHEPGGSAQPWGYHHGVTILARTT